MSQRYPGGSQGLRASGPRGLGASLSQAGGSAADVLLGGVLAQWAPSPEVTPFAAGMIICVLAAAALVFVPETAERQRGGLRIRRPRVPAEIRGAFARVSLTAAAVWAVVAGLFLAVMPSYAGQFVLHSKNLALLALMAALVLVSSVAAQLAVRRGAPPAQAQAVGLVLLAAGLLALVLAAPAQSPALLVTGTVLAGTGHGVAFLAAQDDLTRIAPDRQRAEVSAAFYVCIYLGVSVPVIGIGLVAVATTLFTAVATFAAVTGGGALILAAWHLRNRGQGQPVQSRIGRRLEPTPLTATFAQTRIGPAATLATTASAVGADKPLRCGIVAVRTAMMWHRCGSRPISCLGSAMLVCSVMPGDSRVSDSSLRAAAAACRHRSRSWSS